MGVLSCDDTETLCRKNNLTFVELLQPFSKLMADVTLKDPEGINHSVSNLNLLFQVRKKRFVQTNKQTNGIGFSICETYQTLTI